MIFCLTLAMVLKLGCMDSWIRVCLVLLRVVGAAISNSVSSISVLGPVEGLEFMDLRVVEFP